MVRKALLLCGILSSVLYEGMNIFIPLQFEGYSLTAQTVSELSAIEAPTRPAWIFWGIIYGLLVLAFGWGVWQSAGQNRRLRIVGGLLLADSLIGFFWPPMHLRGVESTLTDTLHIVFAMVTLAFMFLIILNGAAAFGRRFRLYSLLTILVFLVFGILSGIDAPRLAQNLPTPMLGVWERINIAAYMLWIAVFAAAILQRDRELLKQAT